MKSDRGKCREARDTTDTRVRVHRRASAKRQVPRAGLRDCALPVLKVSIYRHAAPADQVHMHRLGMPRLMQFEAVRRRLMPFAEARGFVTDEDVFGRVS